MTIEEAIQILKDRGWCYSHTHPYSGAFDQIIVGPRADTDGYGKFPSGWVEAEWGRGDSVVQAVQIALEREKRKQEFAIEKAIETDVKSSIETKKENHETPNS